MTEGHADSPPLGIDPNTEEYLSQYILNKYLYIKLKIYILIDLSALDRPKKIKIEFQQGEGEFGVFCPRI
jgi:hypothetical protein